MPQPSEVEKRDGISKIVAIAGIITIVVIFVFFPFVWGNFVNPTSEIYESVPLKELGVITFANKACNTCHTIDGRATIGPSVKDLFGSEGKMADGTTLMVDENYLRQSILEPMAHIVDGYQPVMPIYQGLINTREMDAIIAYIKSLSSK